MDHLINAIDTLMLPILAVISALVLFPVCHRIGVRSIQQWLTPQVTAVLNEIHPAWWGVAPAFAVPFAVVIEQWSFDSYLMIIAIGLLLGVLSATLAALIRFDVLCRLLPDALTWLLVISGLLFNSLFGPNTFAVALLGAVMGYGLPWLIAFVWKRIRNSNATMGRGDFAMTAGIGAWLGWQALPLAITIAAGLALLMVVIEQKLFPRRKVLTTTDDAANFLQHEVAFGPALALSTIITWIQIG